MEFGLQALAARRGPRCGNGARRWGGPEGLLSPWKHPSPSPGKGRRLAGMP
jgi:hypothetical protein